MNANSSVRQVATVLGAGAALTLALGGCSSVLQKDQVASTIAAELQKQGVQLDNTVTCPGDLKAEVGETIRCEFATGGQPVDAVARVTSIQGNNANYDITTEARPIAKALLEKKIGDQVGQQAGVAIDNTACSSDLQPEVGQSTTCTVSGVGETINLKVTVTEVSGGQVNYSFEQA